MALQANTDGLTRLVGSAYGGAQADAFTTLWQRHLADLSAYAKGVAGHDRSATQTARGLLLADADADGSWLARASKGPLRWPSAWTPRRSSSGRPLPCCWASTWS